MHLRDSEPVPGDADEADESRVARLHRGFECPAFPQRELPFDHVDEVVQLEQIDAFDAETLEGSPNLLARAPVVTLSGLRREEETAGMAGQPRRDPEFRIAVGSSGVNVVHAMLEECLERTVRLGLRDRAERRGAEDRASALVTGPPERRLRDHRLRVAARRRGVGSCAACRVI